MPVPPDMDDRPPRLWLHAALFLATVITTTGAGALYVHPDSLTPIGDGLPFSVPLLCILLCHEFGHYVVARRHGVKASLPYFIPLPPSVALFGTLGAVIRMPPATDRRKLLDIGAAGPLAGLAAALPILAWGIAQSEVRPLQGFGLQEGNSLVYGGLKLLIKGRWLPGDGLDVMLHPTALAGWAGLLVTMINLLPFGQLDGGHVAVAYFGNRYVALARRLQRALLGVAVGVFLWTFQWARAALGDGELARVAASYGIDPVAVATMAAMPWLVWFGMLLLLRRLAGGDHPPVEDGAPPPGGKAPAGPIARRRVLGWPRVMLFWTVVLVFAGILMPIPLRMSIGKLPEAAAEVRPGEGGASSAPADPGDEPRARDE